MRFKIGKETRDVPYTTGVKQGDNLAPTLFIIVMQALEEIFIKQWTANNITPISLAHSPPNQGSLANHKASSDSLSHLITHMLMYVDDCATLFNTREDTLIGIRILDETMNRLGLTMHT